MTNGRRRDRGDQEAAFTAFLEGWLVRQEHYLEELMSSVASEGDLQELVSRILAHYQQYYDEKSKIAERDIFLVFSPTWFTPLETAFLWIAGFRPGLVFRLLRDSIPDVSEEQARTLARLRRETRLEELSLDNDLARVHEAVAAPPIIDVARRGRRPVDGEIANEDDALANLKAALEAAVAAADSLRTRTALKVMEVLRPAQNVRFLTAAAQLQLRIRSWGLHSTSHLS